MNVNADDEFVCRELGLDVPDGRAGEQFLGLVNLHDGSWVEVTVHNPAVRHWTFTIYSAEEDHVVTLECGSGPIDMYWPFAMQIAEGMVRVRSVIENLSQEVEAAANAEPLAPHERMRLYVTIARKMHALGPEYANLRRSAMDVARQARQQMIRTAALEFLDELRAADQQHPAE